MDLMHPENIQSIGLEFGPNFFTTYMFSDLEGNDFETFESVKIIDRTYFSKKTVESPSPLFGIVHTAGWTLLPEAVFEESEIENYLRFNTLLPDDAVVVFDRILSLQAVIVYLQNQEAEKYTDLHFPGLRLRHVGGILIELISRMKLRNGSDEMFIHSIDDQYTLVVYKKGILTFANQIVTPYQDDFQYFLFYSLQQLSMSQTVKTTLLGDAAESEKASSWKAYLSGIVPLEAQYVSAGQTGGKKVLERGFMARHFIGLFASQCG